jgi:hypothetical protein
MKYGLRALENNNEKSKTNSRLTLALYFGNEFKRPRYYKNT